MRGGLLLILLACTLVAPWLSGCGTLKRGVSDTGVALSMIRSPIFIRTPELNRPLAVPEREALRRMGDSVASGTSRSRAADEHWPTEEGPRARMLDRILPGPSLPPERFETLDALRGKHTLVFVAISGGGARAAVLAKQTMALLERTYNEKASAKGHREDFAPLLDRIDAYSTVSGGSVYAYHVALNHLVGEGTGNPLERLFVRPRFGERNLRFQEMARDARTRRGIHDLGFYTSVGYLAPANLLLGPIATLVTDRSYLDFLAFGLSLSQSFSRFFLPWRIRLGALERRPLFLFNATCLETGSPFVLTQSVLHVPGERTLPRTVRLDRAPSDCCEKPLRHALTLEEVDSSPAAFPLAYAAVASAAYPLGMEPLPVRRYGYHGSEQKVYRTSEVLHLTDGGVYDNSGLTTAVDLFEYLVHTRGGPTPQRLVLLSINAETWNWDPESVKRPSLPERWVWIRADSPIRGLGLSALRLIYFTDQRRVEELAFARLKQLARERGVEVLYFPVNFLQLADTDPFHIRGGAKVFADLQKIGTSYTITDRQATLVQTAAELLLTTSQDQGVGRGTELGWPVGPGGEPVRRLDEAFAAALLQAQQP